VRRPEERFQDLGRHPVIERLDQLDPREVRPVRG
jgi:hypothetical protein